jgi:hypothetical protein
VNIESQSRYVYDVIVELGWRLDLGYTDIDSANPQPRGSGAIIARLCDRPESVK